MPQIPSDPQHDSAYSDISVVGMQMMLPMIFEPCSVCEVRTAAASAGSFALLGIIIRRLNKQ